MFPSLRQVLCLVLCAGILTALVGQLNHALSPWALTCAVPGLFVVFAAFRLSLGVGLASVFLTGLWLDAATPVPFGRHALLLSLAFCLVHRLRSRLPREVPLVGVITALFVNLALFVLFALLGLGVLPDPASGGLRLLADLVVSQVLTALVGPWYLAFQAASLRLLGVPPPSAVSRYA